MVYLVKWGVQIVQLTESLDRFVHIQISLKLLLDGFKIWNQMELKFLWVSLNRRNSDSIIFLG